MMHAKRGWLARAAMAAGFGLAFLAGGKASAQAGFDQAFTDLDGDGINEYATASMTAIKNGAGVTVRSGATRAVLTEFSPQTGDLVFGSAVVVLNDFDGDGVLDYAYTTLMNDGTKESGFGTVRVVSGATGKVLAEVDGEPGDPVDAEHVNLVGDLDGNGVIDEDDMLLFSERISDDGFALDLDGDGKTDFTDALELVARLGLGDSEEAKAGVADTIQNADWYIQEVYVAPQATVAAMAGPIGTAMCKAWCDGEFPSGSKLCYQFCKMLKNASCIGVESLCNHLLRARQKQLAEMCWLFFNSVCSGQ